MQALKLTASKTLEMITSPTPTINKGEMLIKTSYTGICRTDRKCFTMGQQDLQMPRILGHEITGIIVDMDKEIKGYNIGDRVQIHPGIGCGQCADCLCGNDQICSDMEILGFHIDGGFSEYIVIPPAGVNRGIVQKLPTNLTTKLATLAEPLACAVNLEERLQFNSNSSILIIGSGVLGLLTSMLAKIKGVENIVILEKNPYKIDIAINLGFQCFPNDIDTAELEKIMPQGFDVAIPCCPDNNGFIRGIELLNKRGKFGFFSGLTSETALDTKLLNKIHYKELALYGSYGCSLNHGKKALKLLSEHSELFTLPTKYVSLDEVEDILKNLEVDDTILKTVKFEER